MFSETDTTNLGVAGVIRIVSMDCKMRGAGQVSLRRWSACVILVILLFADQVDTLTDNQISVEENHHIGHNHKIHNHDHKYRVSQVITY